MGASGHKVVCVDYDGTLVPWAGLMEDRGLILGAGQALDRLSDAGYEIVIFTSRLSRSWLMSLPGDFESNLVAQVDHVTKVLDTYNVRWDRLTSEKIPAMLYFDDRAVRITKSYTLLDAVTDFLSGTIE